MAESMNHFFVNVGNMGDGKIAIGDTKFSNYLKSPNLNNIFLKPVDKNEIFHLVNLILTSKATCLYSIPTNILKNNILDLAEPLEIIFSSID